MSDNHVTLTRLRYSQDVSGALKLYVFEGEYHHGAQWFVRKTRYPDEEILLDAARKKAEDAMAAGKEVRICNGGDFLVFHAKGGAILYPLEKGEQETFWERAGL